MFRASMSPVAVFDHEYDNLSVIESGPYSNAPSYPEATLATRYMDVYNDDLSDPSTALTLNWKVRLYGAETSSGTMALTVPLGTVASQVGLSFRVPLANTNGLPFLLCLEIVKSNVQVFSTYYVFKVNGVGGVPVPGLGTFHDDFSDSMPVGWREHDATWKVTGGVYQQSSIEGLYPNNQEGRDHSTCLPAASAYGQGDNTKIAGVEGYSFGDFNASFDMHVTAAVGFFQGGGMGLRLTHLDDGVWFQPDPSRDTGYFVLLRRDGDTDFNPNGQSWWRLVIVKCGPFPTPQTDLAIQSVQPPVGWGRMTLTVAGPQITATWGHTTVVATDSQYRGGYASLITMQNTAAQFDNVAIGGAPLPPLAVMAQRLMTTEVQVGWNASVGAADYQVNWTSALSQGTTLWASGTSQTIPNLPSGVYTFTVLARNANGEFSAASLPLTGSL
jgi:hypothetical protein